MHRQCPEPPRAVMEPEEKIDTLCPNVINIKPSQFHRKILTDIH